MAVDCSYSCARVGRILMVSRGKNARDLSITGMYILQSERDLSITGMYIQLTDSCVLS